MIASTTGSWFRRAVNRMAPAAPPLTPRASDWVERHGTGRLIPLRDEVRLTLPLPVTAGPVEAVFEAEREVVLPPRYLAVLPDVTLRGRDGFVVLPDGSYLTETADAAWMKPHPAYRQRFQAKPERVSGPCLSLLGLHCREHYHWIADALARLHRVLPHLPSDCRIVVPDGLKPDQLEMLERVGVRPESLVHFHSGRPLRFDEFWFASPAAPDRFDDPEAVAWLRSKLWPELREEEKQRGRRLFVSRAAAETRRIVNEEELLPVLERFGFEVVHPERLTMQEQARLFAGADIVTGGHGAGFTNILFSRSGCRLVELFPERVGFRTYYWSLANACGISHAYLCGQTLGGGTADRKNYRIAPEALADALQHPLTPHGSCQTS